MTQSEGVIQYTLDFRHGDLPAAVDCAPLFRWFRRCRELALIGQDPARYGGYAYGNLSLRSGAGFVISATQTGGRSGLLRADLAFVEAFDADRNWLRARGPARPSSEAMTHGQIYAVLPAVQAIIHVHSAAIWRQADALDLPTTAPEAGYGTPAMAAEVERLVCAGADPTGGILAMGGHEDGIIAYGATMDQAGALLVATLERAALHAAHSADHDARQRTSE